MRGILADIQSGKFARDWVLENQAGAASFLAQRRRQAELQVAKVGDELRALVTEGEGGDKPMSERKAFTASDAEWCYHDGELVKMGDVRLSPATHALNYGTGVFEGIRAYWNENKGTLQVLKLREHYERFEKSCRMLRIDLPASIDEMCDITLEILRRNAPREDTYIRPLSVQVGRLGRGEARG